MISAVAAPSIAMFTYIGTLPTLAGAATASTGSGATAGGAGEIVR